MKSLMLGGLSALLLLGAGPLTIGAGAQVFSSQRNPQNGSAQRGQVAQQSSVLRTRLERDETLYLDRKGTYDYDLVLQSEASFGGRRLPVGTIIRGQFEPAEGGLVYVADSVELADRIVQINAVSELMRDDKDPRQTSTGAILTDAAIGAAGGYVLGEVFGDAGVWEVIGGAAAGVVVGNTTAPLVVVVKPEQEIALFSN
ncbi:MAG: hypothetical protein AAFQ40_15770 [Cyanobacteria bacterium J06623_5]